MNVPFQTGISRRRGRKADLAKAGDDFDYSVIDVETTGLDPLRDGIVSFGAVPIVGGRITVQQGVQFFVNPECAVGIDAVKIHAIRDDDLRDKPKISSYGADIATVVRGRIVVAHSAWVEEGFLARAFGRRHLPFDLPIVDTARMALRAMDLPPLGHADVSLEFLSQALGLPTHTPHEALSDAMTTAQVFLVLANRLATEDRGTLGDLLRLSASPRKHPGSGLLRSRR